MTLEFAFGSSAGSLFLRLRGCTLRPVMVFSVNSEVLSETERHTIFRP